MILSSPLLSSLFQKRKAKKIIEKHKNITLFYILGMKMKYPKLLQSLAKFMENFTQVLASISLFSFLFSYYSSYLSSFFTYYLLNFSFSTFPFQLLSHAMDKNFVFLICNGIFLVLLANTSSEEEKEEEEEEEKAEEEGFLNEFQEAQSPICIGTRASYLETSKEEAEEDGFLNEFQEAKLPICIGTRASYLETSKEVVHVHEDEMSIQLSKSDEVPLDVENSNIPIVECKQDEATSEGHEVLDEEKEEGGIEGEECSRPHEIVEVDGCEENDFLNEEEEVEESDEPLNKLSNEELNKKFEEFIRKMKEEIRIEARQQLVLVK